MNEEATGPERRRHPRYALLAQVRVHRGREDFVMELVNISRSGALVDMGHIPRPRWLEAGRELQIAITHPVSLALVQLKGSVRRIVEQESGTGFAVEFGEGDEGAMEAIAELVALAAESVPGGQPPPLPKKP